MISRPPPGIELPEGWDGEWERKQPLLALDAIGQPLVDILVSIIRKQWTNEELSEQEKPVFQLIISRR